MIEHHKGELYTAVYSRDGNYFASGACDKIVNVYEGGLKMKAFYET